MDSQKEIFVDKITIKNVPIKTKKDFIEYCKDVEGQTTSGYLRNVIKKMLNGYVLVPKTK